jgi:hypothetical protein
MIKGMVVVVVRTSNAGDMVVVVVVVVRNSGQKIIAGDIKDAVSCGGDGRRI